MTSEILEYFGANIQFVVSTIELILLAYLGVACLEEVIG